MSKDELDRAVERIIEDTDAVRQEIMAEAGDIAGNRDDQWDAALALMGVTSFQEISKHGDKKSGVDPVRRTP